VFLVPPYLVGALFSRRRCQEFLDSVFVPCASDFGDVLTRYFKTHFGFLPQIKWARYFATIKRDLVTNSISLNAGLSAAQQAALVCIERCAAMISSSLRRAGQRWKTPCVILLPQNAQGWKMGEIFLNWNHKNRLLKLFFLKIMIYNFVVIIYWKLHVIIYWKSHVIYTHLKIMCTLK
jgi:hypothetical protein